MNEFEELRYIDLFCGLGAFHTAFTRNSNKKKSIHVYMHVTLIKMYKKFIMKIIT